MHRKIDAAVAEVHKVSSETIKWVAGIVIGSTILSITLMTFVLNNAIPKSSSPSPAPVVITLPSGAVPAR